MLFAKVVFMLKNSDHGAKKNLFLSTGKKNFFLSTIYRRTPLGNKVSLQDLKGSPCREPMSSSPLRHPLFPIRPRKINRLFLVLARVRFAQFSGKTKKKNNFFYFLFFAEINDWNDLEKLFLYQKPIRLCDLPFCYARKPCLRGHPGVWMPNSCRIY